MAKKRKKTEIKHVPTKHQVSKLERQRKTHRIIVITAGVFLALIVAIVGYGYYDAQVKPLQQKVMKVNDKIIDMNYYMEWLNVFLRGVDYTRAPLMAEMVLSNILQNELVIQRVPNLGITVSDAEITDALKKDNLPIDRFRQDVYKANLLSDKLMNQYFEPKVPTVAKQVKAEAMFLESEYAANEVLAKLKEGETFTKLAKEMSIEEFTKTNSGELGWLIEGATNIAAGKFGDSQLGTIAFSTASGTVSKPTYDSSVRKSGGFWILEVTERDKDNKSCHVRGILTSTEAEAYKAKRKLTTGTDFAVVAKEMSQDPNSRDLGGDLGWFQRGEKDDAISKVVFTALTREIMDPVRDDKVKTEGGYWLVKVIDVDNNRQVDKATRDSMKTKMFQDWLEEQRTSSTIERYLDEQQKAWAVEYTLRKMGS